MQLNTAQQFLYLIELMSIIVGCFAGGFLLLGSKRPKDEPYKRYGWLMYAVSWVGLFFMVILVRGFAKGG